MRNSWTIKEFIKGEETICGKDNPFEKGFGFFITNTAIENFLFCM